MTLLFRAEWDNKEENEFEHPQPHWHFHPQIEYLVEGTYLDNATFKTYLDLINKEGFEKELSEKTLNKPNNISSFHFAMSSRWQDKKSAIIPLKRN
ncbi:MAG TPA: hypothetical protein VGQ09_21220 [Chitinophagaceae bacterium]|jgi:hypothetical protein|nr:hypothetical protein [Chitinophagaceae bacterium]